jgi:NodT family efflux transporter outer membrane factor (OMF) lipoprotein
LPSTLLQRRPDITAAQQRIAAANASVGVARTAFFPSVTLGVSGGYQSSDLSNFIAAPNIFWAIGPGVLVNLLDGGRRKAGVARAEAVLDEAGQTYRSVVLAAFQQVEDQLALLDHYADAAAAERMTVLASKRAVTLATNRFRDGAASYLEVVTAQATHLQAQRSALALSTRQRRASVQLVRSLGGGWSVSLLQARAGN